MKNLFLTSMAALTLLSLSGVASASNPFVPFKVNSCEDWRPAHVGYEPGSGLLISELRGLAEAKCMHKGLYAHAASELIVTSQKTKILHAPYGAIIMYKTCGERFFVCR